MGLLEDAMGGAAPGYCPPWDAGQPLPVGVGSGAPRGKRDRSEAEAFSRTCWWPDRDPVPDSPPACRWHLSSHGGGTRGETSDGAVLPQGLTGNSAGLHGRAGSRPVMPGGAWTSPHATAPGPLSRDRRSPALPLWLLPGPQSILLLPLVSYLLLSFQSSDPPGPPWHTRPTESEQGRSSLWRVAAEAPSPEALSFPQGGCRFWDPGKFCGPRRAHVLLQLRAGVLL